MPERIRLPKLTGRMARVRLPKPTASTARISTLSIIAVAAAFGLTNSRRLRDMPAPGADAAVGAATRVATAKTVGSSSNYLGFDTYQYPGDEIMRAWRHEDVPYEWVGYYLPAPCHKGTSWVGKRERLIEMGWGIAIIYVGQQTWDRTPREYETTWRVERRTVTVPKRVQQTVVKSGKKTKTWVTKNVRETKTVRIPTKVKIDPTQRPIDQCNADLISAARGRIEADDAIRRTESEGFPHGSVIFLDIERMDRIPLAMREYYRTWTERVIEDGRYVPGYYAHKANAAEIYTDVKAVYAAKGLTREPAFWIAGGSEFSPEKSPTDVGHAFAAMWQGVLDIVQEWQGYKLPIDVNLSYLSDPSAPESAETQ